MSGSLSFEVLAKSGAARRGVVTTSHGKFETPVFMPVGTQGTIKGLFPDQMQRLDCHMLLGNTYHLELHPGTQVLSKVGGLHRFMNWPRSILTDSGGFQMVSLLELSETDEKGVTFSSPRDGSKMLLSPEKSMEIQQAIGSDIAMQLDDVIKTTSVGLRVEEAMERSVRWLNRCFSSHELATQTVFPIIQGGLDLDLRTKCIKSMSECKASGYAIGGLSGGEDKLQFGEVVRHCSTQLPENGPKYCMGVGYLDDIIVCVAYGVDMFDCVYPTRTARFGTAITSTGNIQLRHAEYELDFSPIDFKCDCFTCRNYTRSYIHCLITKETSACHLLTIHNLHFYMDYMKKMRGSISDGSFKEFYENHFRSKYPDGKYPNWIADALRQIS